MATKKKTAAEDDLVTDENILLQRSLAIEMFVHNARAIAENEKTEKLIKMTHDCPKLKPVTPANKELWEIVQRVRQEVLGGASRPARKATSRRKAKGKD